MVPGVDLARLPLHDRRRRLLDRLLWLPVNLLQVVSFLLVCLILIPLALLAQRLTGDSRVALWIAHRWWGPIIVAGGLAKLRVRGRDFIESDKTYLIVANHQSYLDIPVLYSALPAPLHFLAVDYLANLPGIGHFGKAVGTIYLSKASPFRGRQSRAGTRQLPPRRPHHSDFSRRRTVMGRASESLPPQPLQLGHSGQNRNSSPRHRKLPQRHATRRRVLIPSSLHRGAHRAPHTHARLGGF